MQSTVWWRVGSDIGQEMFSGHHCETAAVTLDSAAKLIASVHPVSYIGISLGLVMLRLYRGNDKPGAKRETMSRAYFP